MDTADGYNMIQRRGLQIGWQQYYFNPDDIDLFNEDRKINDILWEILCISFVSFCGIHLPASKLANAPAAI